MWFCSFGDFCCGRRAGLGVGPGESMCVSLHASRHGHLHWLSTLIRCVCVQCLVLTCGHVCDSGAHGPRHAVKGECGCRCREARRSGPGRERGDEEEVVTLGEVKLRRKCAWGWHCWMPRSCMQDVWKAWIQRMGIEMSVPDTGRRASMVTRGFSQCEALTRRSRVWTTSSKGRHFQPQQYKTCDNIITCNLSCRATALRSLAQRQHEGKLHAVGAHTTVAARQYPHSILKPPHRATTDTLPGSRRIHGV